MGLSFHYSGYIKEMSLIKPMVEEVADICNGLQWKYHIFDNNPEGLSGICFSARDCEPVFLTFLPNGRLCSLLNITMKEIYRDNEELFYTASTKTQFAGPDVHIAIIKLLRYLQPKYFAGFNVDDEGLYWETQDEKVLLSQFEKYNRAMEQLIAALNDFEKLPNETAESLSSRLEQFLKNKSKGKE